MSLTAATADWHSYQSKVYEDTRLRSSVDCSPCHSVAIEKTAIGRSAVYPTDQLRL